MNDAKVLCRQLGFIDAEAAYRSSTIVSRDGQIWLDAVGCRGNESSIFECANRGWGVHNCNRRNAAVRCSRQGILSTNLHTDLPIYLSTYLPTYLQSVTLLQVHESPEKISLSPFPFLS